MEGIILKPNPTKKVMLDLRDLIKNGFDFAKSAISIEVDNSENAFRRIVLRRRQGASRNYLVMSPESEIRASQAEHTWKWVVTEEGRKREQDTVTF